jgi:hypothetical protein
MSPSHQFASSVDHLLPAPFWKFYFIARRGTILPADWLLLILNVYSTYSRANIFLYRSRRTLSEKYLEILRLGEIWTPGDRAAHFIRQSVSALKNSFQSF